MVALEALFVRIAGIFCRKSSVHIPFERKARFNRKSSLYKLDRDRKTQIKDSTTIVLTLFTGDKTHKYGLGCLYWRTIKRISLDFTVEEVVYAPLTRHFNFPFSALFCTNYQRFKHSKEV